MSAAQAALAGNTTGRLTTALHHLGLAEQHRSVAEQLLDELEVIDPSLSRMNPSDVADLRRLRTDDFDRLPDD